MSWPKHAALAKMLMFAMLISVSASAGTLYTIDEGEDRLMAIEEGTWSAAYVGPADYGTVDALVYSTDGWLYGVDYEIDSLLRIDPETGVLTTIGSLGFDLEYGHASDMAEDSNGQLWLTASGILFTVDRTTGAATAACDSSSDRLYGLVIVNGQRYTGEYSQNPSLPPIECDLTLLPLYSWYEALSKGPSGTIFSISPLPYQWPTTGLGWWNPVTETGEFCDGFEGSHRGLAYQPDQPSPPAIPVLGRFGLLILVVLLTVAALAVLMRKV